MTGSYENILTDTQQSERKHRYYEELLAKQRQIQEELAMIDPETRREVDEFQRVENDIKRFASGFQSEPTTPPEYHNFPIGTPLHRYSSASMASPPGFAGRPSRSGSQIASPAAKVSRPMSSHILPSQLQPSQSVPGSRRNSDEEEEEDYTYGFTESRAAAKYVDIPCVSGSDLPRSHPSIIHHLLHFPHSTSQDLYKHPALI